MPRKIGRIERTFILDNPHIQPGKLALILGLKAGTIKSFRLRKKQQSNWAYSGVGVPFMRFDGTYRVQYRHSSMFWSNSFDKSLQAAEHLIWCIENKMFDAKRIEHPYFENLEFIKSE